MIHDTIYRKLYLFCYVFFICINLFTSSENKAYESTPLKYLNSIEDLSSNHRRLSVISESHCPDKTVVCLFVRGGYYVSYDCKKCLPCLPGQYCPDFQKAYYCDPGSYNDMRRQGNCKKCPVNSYQPNINGTSCLSCPLNSHSLSGATTCVCDPGFSSFGLGSSLRCLPCAINTYSVEGSCPGGYTYSPYVPGCYFKDSSLPLINWVY